MKKALLVLAVLCVAGIFSAKAQSASDSAFVRDLSYTYINAGSLPYTNSGDISLSTGGKILKDLHPDSRATGYTINLTSSKNLDIKLSSGYWDSYLYVLDANFDTIIYNDDWKRSDYYFGSRIIHNFSAGQYYIIVVELSSGSSSQTYTLSVDETATTFTALNALTYTPLTLGTPVTDTLKTTDGPLAYDYYARFFRATYARAYTMQINNACEFDVTLNRSNRDYMLLDNNYNKIYSNVISTPGTYRLVVFSHLYFDEDTSTTTPFTLTASATPIVNYNTLTYVPLGTFTDSTVNDTFSSSYQSIDYNGYLIKAKGYSFQGAQNKVVLIEDYYDNAIFVLMDNNHNILKSGYSINTQLTQNGTYYLAIINGVGNVSSTTISIKNFQTYYVDGINGDDARNGLTPSTAFATLDTAIVRSGGVGKYYLTEDYTFSNNYLSTYYAHIYPYQKDIRLHMPTSSSDNILDAYGELVFGEQGGNYYFIIDSNHTDLYYGLLYGYSGCSMSMNNLKVRNSYFQDFIYNADELVIRNCEFVNDTFEEYFIVKGYDESRNVQIINTDFSQNFLNYYFIRQNGGYYDPDTMVFTLENTNVVGNTFGYPQWIYNGAFVNLVSGSWRNNRLESDYSYNGNPNLSVQNWGGIWLWGVTATIGAGFSMDVNNYLSIDTATTLTIEENLSGNNVAQIYPYRFDGNDELYKADYYEGRRVLWGTSSLLANNYRKFNIAQADNTSMWYIHPDGTIHTYPIGIDQAEEGTISLYPNPANNVLNIALQGTEVNEAVVIDIYGKTVARTTVSEGNNTLDISALPAGMYFVQLRANNSVKATQKIVKR